MSKLRPESADELRPEYDFQGLPSGVRGKYLRRYRAGTNLALLDPDVAMAFPTDAAVNDALRMVLKAAAAVRRVPRTSNKALHRTAGASLVRDRPRVQRRAARH